MNIDRIDLRISPDRTEAIDRAAGILARGGLVVLPTETVYGLAGSAASEISLERLWKARGAGERAPLAWHLGSTDKLFHTIWGGESEAPPVHHRLISRLTPGSVTFAIPLSPERLAAVRMIAGAVPGAFDDGSELLVRIPAVASTRQILDRSGTPVVMASLSVAGRIARDAGDASEAIAQRGGSELVEMIVDEGPVALNRLSTLVRLEADGSYTVARAGAIEERYIQKQLTRTMLFVCTGNTCRSPMAEAIARHVEAQRPADGLKTEIRSAGTTAGWGMDATPEGVEAVQRMGIEMGRHASTPLTRELVNEADVIYVMTQAHGEAVRRMVPDAADRIHLLDPTGRDIPDPIGGPQELYDETARMIRAAIEQRFGITG